MEDIIFTVDVGTRKIAAIVAKIEKDGKLKVLGSSYRIHHDRALIDGQVEDIEQTSKHIIAIKEKLENKLDIKLKKVNLAVAGRGLKSIKIKTGIDIRNEEVTEEDMNNAIMQALATAQRNFSNAGLVGYNVNTYFVDGYPTNNPKYRRGRHLEVEIIATFLPEQPVYALLKAAELAELQVSFITLEPIAAITATIPQEIRQFHLALVDIGGGTSDISISKNGKIIGYDVIPIAGDEITEAISNQYLLPFTTAERVKIKLTHENEVITRDILGNKLTINRTEFIKTIQPVIDTLTDHIAEKILSLGKTAPRAVILVGGGSKTPLIKEFISKKLNIPIERVGIRFPLSRGFKILPRRIAEPSWAVAVGTTLLAAKQQGIPLIEVKVNGIPISLFSINQPTVKDALIRLGLSIKELYGKPSPGTVINIDGKIISFPGILGSPPRITVSGNKASINTEISNGDTITISKGDDAPTYIPSVEDVLNQVIPEIYIDEKKVSVNFHLLDLNGNKVENIVDSGSYKIFPSTIQELIEYLHPEWGTLETISPINPNTRLIDLKVVKLTKKVYNENKMLKQSSKDNGEFIYILTPIKNIVIPYRKGDIVASVLSQIPDIISELMKQGNKINIYVNSRKAKYSTPLTAGDKIELKPEID